jgi:prolyl 3-hydroxylase /prolyl 3,4-dihydroxylase
MVSSYEFASRLCKSKLTVCSVEAFIDTLNRTPGLEKEAAFELLTGPPFHCLENSKWGPGFDLSAVVNLSIFCFSSITRLRVSTMSLKRKADSVEDSLDQTLPSKKRNAPSSIRSAFRTDLFDDSTVSSFRTSYKDSTPYPHAVVSNLIEDTLLRDVRNEIKEHIHFTLKETDIYRIHQSGDLANLSNLDAESLQHLPNLVRLRDALYSPDFREWVSEVTGAGKLSGQKTDMAVNVYTPGSYLLCHDDVIGSRRVSYILYLTDPGHPWKKEWGGGLRLYPTETAKNKQDENIKVPLPEHTVNIPPSFGQLSFFAVRPGESYHDVEEVYHATPDEKQLPDGGRIRMAISGWYHIPQSGEDGFEEGVEQALAQRSSLAQLKGAANEFDEPQANFRHYDEPRRVMNSSATALEDDAGDESDPDQDILTEQDLTFLLQYISPSYLTPYMTDQFSATFADTSVLQLESFFAPKFADPLKQYILSLEQSDATPQHWQTARPPHKHRYQYLQSSESLHQSMSPIAQILTDLLHSHAFKKWLAIITDIKAQYLVRQDVLARHFRRGKDYALASPFSGEQQLEFTIGMTPDQNSKKNGDVPEEDIKQAATNTNGTNGHTTDVKIDTAETETDLGGEEIYISHDDSASTSSHKHLPQVGRKSAATSATTSTTAKAKADPAVYRAEDEDDGILFSDSPSWNTLSVVLRDQGVLRFVKYLCRDPDGVGSGRWDVKGEVELGEGAFEEGEEEDGVLDDGEEDGEEEEDDDEGEDDDEDDE